MLYRKRISGNTQLGVFVKFNLENTAHVQDPSRKVLYILKQKLFMPPCIQQERLDSINQARVSAILSWFIYRIATFQIRRRRPSFVRSFIRSSVRPSSSSSSRLNYHNYILIEFDHIHTNFFFFFFSISYVRYHH